MALAGSQERDRDGNVRHTRKAENRGGDVQLGYGKGDENGEKKMTGEEEAGVKSGAAG